MPCTSRFWMEIWRLDWSREGLYGLKSSEFTWRTTNSLRNDVHSTEGWTKVCWRGYLKIWNATKFLAEVEPVHILRAWLNIWVEDREAVVSSHYWQVYPPSTAIEIPVTHFASSLARKTATLAISSGLPSPLNGCMSDIFPRVSFDRFAIIAVSVSLVKY